MATEVLMPQLGLTMKEGLVMEWKRREGEAVAKGQVLLSVENDKAVLDVEAQADGVLLKILVPEMSSAPVGSVIAYIGAAGEVSPSTAAPSTAAPSTAAPSTAAPSTAAPAAAAAPAGAPSQASAKAEPAKVALSGSAASIAAPAAPPKPAAVVPAPRPGLGGAAADGFALASPLARRTAAALGIELSSVRGTGPEGAVIARDLPAAPAGAAPASAALPAAQGFASTGALAAPQGAGYDDIRLSRVQVVGAERMAESWATIPQFTLYDEADAGAILALAARLKEKGRPVSLTVILAKLLARGALSYPMVNATWLGDGRVRAYREVNVNVAVDTEAGLLVPVLRDCGARGLSALGSEMRRLSEGAKAGTLPAADHEGGTITLSNLGMFGVKRFRAIVNPPQAAILAVGAVSERVVSGPSGFEARKFLEFSVTADHRVVDGAYAARFLSALRDMIEDPALGLE